MSTLIAFGASTRAPVSHLNSVRNSKIFIANVRDLRRQLQDNGYRPGIGSRRFAIVIKTTEMYSLGMHSVPL